MIILEFAKFPPLLKALCGWSHTVVGQLIIIGSPRNVSPAAQSFMLIDRKPLTETKAPFTHISILLHQDFFSLTILFVQPASGRCQIIHRSDR